MARQSVDTVPIWRLTASKQSLWPNLSFECVRLFHARD
jgi:hypothetical protein